MRRLGIFTGIAGVAVGRERYYFRGAASRGCLSWWRSRLQRLGCYNHGSDQQEGSTGELRALQCDFDSSFRLKRFSQTLSRDVENDPIGENRHPAEQGLGIWVRLPDFCEGHAHRVQAGKQCPARSGQDAVDFRESLTDVHVRQRDI